MATKWKKNKLLASFLESKKVWHKSSRTPQPPRAKRFKATFSQLSDPVDNVTDQQTDIQDSDSESEVQNSWTNFDGYENSVDYNDGDGPRERRRQHRSHQGMTASQLESWKSSQAALISSHIAGMGMPPGQECTDCSNFAQYRCKDCSPNAFYCRDCCAQVHRYNNIYHYPEKWVNSRFVLAPLRNAVVRLTHNCETSYGQKITVVSSEGV